MNVKLLLPTVVCGALFLTSCAGGPSSSSGATVASSKKEPTQLRLSVPESSLKFNNLFYGEPLRLETEKTKCRKNMENPLCANPFKLYHIGSVSEANLPLLQLLLVDTNGKDTATDEYAKKIEEIISSGKTNWDGKNDLMSRFNEETPVEVVQMQRGNSSNVDFASYYVVSEKNKKQMLYYVVAKKVKNTVVVARLGAGLNKEANKESFSTYEGCGKTCSPRDKAVSYIEKKASFAGYKELLDRVQKTLVSFE